MKAQSVWLIPAALAIIMGPYALAAPAPLMRHTFEESASGWSAFGQNSKASVTHEAAQVKEGKAALQFDYSIGKSELGVLMLPTPDAALAKAQSFRFWVKSDHTTPLVVVLQEHEGGRYTAFFTVPKEAWQRVELAPSDFSLGEEANDPKDPDHRLDLDRVEAITLADLSQLFAQAEDPAVKVLLGVSVGPHTIFLDDLVVSEEALPDPMPSTSGEVRLDAFVRPQVSWMGVGGVRLSVSSPGAAGSGLVAEYHVAPGKLVGFARRIPRGRLAGMERLMFEATSVKPVRLLVQVEEVGGGKYNTMIDLPGESATQKISLKLSDFAAADDSKDSNGHLDLDQVHQVLILDPTGLLEMKDQDNTLRISHLRAAPPVK